MKKAKNKNAGVSRSASRHMRGFLFTVLALVLISFIFISVQLWAQTTQVEEARAASRFKVEAMRTSLAMVSADSLERFSNASMIYALDTLARGIEDHPSSSIAGLPYDTSGRFWDGTAQVNRSMYDLMVHGSTSGGLYTSGTNQFFYFDNTSNLTFPGNDPRGSLQYYFNQTRAAARLLGYDIVWGNVSHFYFRQTGVWNVTVSFEVPMNLTDSNGQLSVTRTFYVKTSTGISGFSDPMVQRRDRAYRTNPNLQPEVRPHRNVYHVPDYNDSYTAQAKLIGDSAPGPVKEGMGWFFGPVVGTDNNSFTSNDPVRNVSKIGSFIYEAKDIPDAVVQSQYFGAILLSGAGGENYIDNGTLRVDSTCEYKVKIQAPTCLYCIRYFEPNSSFCPAKMAEIMAETIPYNRDIPYAAVGATLPKPSENYRLGLPEVLMSSKNNATDIFGTNRRTSDSIDVLRRKFADPYPHSDSKIYDMTGPRDLAICGYYVASLYGPAYLQRLVALKPYDGHTPYSPQGYGIESFITGRWAGGADDPVVDWKNTARVPSDLSNARSERFSRLEYQFYPSSTSDCSGSFVQGMPGCKSYLMCSLSDAEVSPRADATGRFALANKTTGLPLQDPIYRYNLTGIQYQDGGMVRECH